MSSELNTAASRSPPLLDASVSLGLVFPGLLGTNLGTLFVGWHGHAHPADLQHRVRARNCAQQPESVGLFPLLPAPHHLQRPPAPQGQHLLPPNHLLHPHGAEATFALCLLNAALCRQFNSHNTSLDCSSLPSSQPQPQHPHLCSVLMAHGTAPPQPTRSSPPRGTSKASNPLENSKAGLHITLLLQGRAAGLMLQFLGLLSCP